MLGYVLIPVCLALYGAMRWLRRHRIMPVPQLMAMAGAILFITSVALVAPRPKLGWPVAIGTSALWALGFVLLMHVLLSQRREHDVEFGRSEGERTNG